ncbi:S8 family serine peptidase [Hamadaea sp. NPDC050747]|uniref:S8 family serine peptidase n=1 Tax=Hamadaea sp. NPDC050747 TaxID=3155789 RepID=UPI0033EB71BC
MVVLIGLIATPGIARADDLTSGQWYVSFLKLAAAHKVTTGAGVTVAIIDSGVDATHPDLRGRVVSGADFTEGGQVSTGDGTRDIRGHGTQMAGLIVGNGRVQGVAPGATIVPINDHTTTDAPSSGALVEGIKWAVAHNVDVISISAGGPDSPLLKRAVDLAIQHDIVVVAAAGNVGQSTELRYPAAYPGVVAVCGVDRQGNHSSVSATVPPPVLCAPSDNISSTYPGSRYAVGSGTSQATALVAGSVALIRAKFPSISAADVVNRLADTATDKGELGRDNVYGYGIVNILDALVKDVPLLGESAAVAASTGQHGTNDGGSSGRWEPWYLALGGLVFLVFMAVAGAASAALVTRSRRQR